jgi:hypothetical protein
MGAGKWAREDEFKRLFQAQMKRMTRDGLETLVYIAIKDMNEVSDDCSLVLSCAFHASSGESNCT